VPRQSVWELRLAPRHGEPPDQRRHADRGLAGHRRHRRRRRFCAALGHSATRHPRPAGPRLRRSHALLGPPVQPTPSPCPLPHWGRGIGRDGEQ